MNSSGIYRWRCIPTEKPYIGQAEDLAKRKREFLNFKGNAKYSTKSDNVRGIDAARKKYPDEKYWDYKVLIECKKNWLDYWEMKCIAINQSKTNGYNLTRGGTRGTKDYKHTKATRRIIGEKQKAFQDTLPYEVKVERARYASSFVDRNNPVYKRHHSEALMGHIEPSETREKIRRSQEKNMKAVIKLDKNKNFIAEYRSIMDAVRSIVRDDSKEELNRCKSAVHNCLNPKNTTKSARGYIFIYKDK